MAVVVGDQPLPLQRAPDLRPAVAWWRSGFWQLIREAHLVTMVGDPVLTRNKLVVGVSCCLHGLECLPYVPPGLPRLSQTPASAVRVMQPVITLLPPSVFGICICICLADKGESILSKGLCTCSRNIEWEKWLFALCSKYIHWCNCFPQLFYCLFTAGYPLETIDPCPLVNIYPNTHTQTE